MCRQRHGFRDGIAEPGVDIAQILVIQWCSGHVITGVNHLGITQLKPLPAESQRQLTKVDIAFGIRVAIVEIADVIAKVFAYAAGVTTVKIELVTGIVTKVDIGGPGSQVEARVVAIVYTALNGDRVIRLGGAAPQIVGGGTYIPRYSGLASPATNNRPAITDSENLVCFILIPSMVWVLEPGKLDRCRYSLLSVRNERILCQV